MKPQLMNYEIDQVEILGRKEGVLFVRKGFHRNRDLLISFVESIGRSVVLITVGRTLSKIESIQHYKFRSIIRINKDEPSGLLKWSENSSVYSTVTPSVEKAIFLAKELAQRGDVVVFSPYGTKDEIADWFALFNIKMERIGL